MFGVCFKEAAYSITEYKAAATKRALREADGVRMW